MSDPITSDSQGVLSRLGQWFKSGSAPHSLDSPQALAIRHKRLAGDDVDGRERQKRKLRVDLVRKSEFAELRGMLSQVMTSIEPSHLASSRHAHSAVQQRHVRAETREKIDSIEEQMSKSWYASSMNSGADNPSTSTLGPLGTKQGHQPGNAQRIMRSRVGDQLQDFAYPPEAVNAAIAYAIGDYISAERILTSICTRRDRIDRLLTSWELRFELYLSINKKSEFEDAAVDFAAKFGKSPHVWTGPWGVPAVEHYQAPGPGTASQPPPLPDQGVPLPPHLDLNGIHLLLQQTSQAKATGVLRINWAPVQSLHVEALDALISLFEHFATWNGRLEFGGSAQLQHLLEMQAKQADPDQYLRKRWLLFLLAIRVTGDDAAFEEASVEYCVSQEESAPIWAVPLCQFQALSPPSLGTNGGEEADFEPTRLLAEAPAAPSSGRISVDSLARTIFLKDTLKGDIRAAMAHLPIPTPTQAIYFECAEMVRIDAQAAGHLLGFLRQAQVGQGEVHFRRIHRLVSLYLFSLGLPQHVTLSLIPL